LNIALKFPIRLKIKIKKSIGIGFSQFISDEENYGALAQINVSICRKVSMDNLILIIEFRLI
jgi:hypothetical protein